MSLPARALRTIRKHQLFPAGARVLVALSGGADSVALLHVLRALAADGAVTLAGAAHLNHLLRGDDAEGDEQFCRGLAAAWDLPLVVERVDVAGAARDRRRSVEDTARALRYAFLLRAADRLSADAVAVGHTRDDQAETFLLRLLRGSGSRGLGGIRPRAGRVVRPLLEISRADLRAYAAAHGLPWREDATNQDRSIPRNRIRHELLPQLETYAPGIAATLARTAALLREDDEYLTAEAAAHGGAVVRERGERTLLDAARLTALPPALASRVALLALETRAPGRHLGFEHVQKVLELAAGAEGDAAALPGQVGRRTRTTVELALPPPVAFSNFFSFPLSVPGEVQTPGWSISAAWPPPGGAVPALEGRGCQAVVAAGPLREPLTVRSRRPGDRFRPLGMGGKRRKLQDFLVDRKVARRERDGLPLVVDRDDRIVWVVGHGVAEDFRVTAPEEAVILLTARRLGGPG